MPDIFDPIAWTVARRLGGGNSGGGSGLPSGSSPNQYIVTDGEGNAKWEDKLCWSEEGKVTLVELFRDSYSKLNPNRNSIPIALEEGKSYTVKWDYDEYDCTCFVAYIDDVGSVLGIGNASLMELGADTNEPFLICVLGSETLVKAQTSGLHELSISGIGEIIHKISGKCVEGMGWREDDTVITWDGNTDGLVSTPGAGDTVIYLVSDFIPAGDYKETIHTTFSHGYEVDAPLIAAEDGLLVYGDGEVFFALRDNVTVNGITFPNAGTYFCIMPVYDDAGNSEQVYPTEIRVGGAIHPIDKKYLPSGGGATVCWDMYNEVLFANPESPSVRMTVEQAKSLPVPCTVKVYEQGNYINTDSTIVSKVVESSKVVLYWINVFDDGELVYEILPITVEGNSGGPS